MSGKKRLTATTMRTRQHVPSSADTGIWWHTVRRMWLRPKVLSCGCLTAIAEVRLAHHPAGRASHFDLRNMPLIRAMKYPNKPAVDFEFRPCRGPVDNASCPPATELGRSARDADGGPEYIPLSARFSTTAAISKNRAATCRNSRRRFASPMSFASSRHFADRARRYAASTDTPCPTIRLAYLAEYRGPGIRMINRQQPFEFGLQLS